MGRFKRIFLKEVIYHIYGRGNNKQKIFGDDDDRCFFKNCFQKIAHQENILIASYSLMPNHYHFILKQMSETPVYVLMHRFLISYAQRWNEKYNCVGHLFQGPFGYSPCLDSDYLFNLVGYLHTNAVEAGLVTKPADYRWSSHHVYMNPKIKSIIDKRIFTDPVFMKVVEHYRNTADLKISEEIKLAIEIAMNKGLSHPLKTLTEIAMSNCKKQKIQFDKKNNFKGQGKRHIRGPFVKMAVKEGYSKKIIANWLSMHKTKL